MPELPVDAGLAARDSGGRNSDDQVRYFLIPAGRGAWLRSLLLADRLENGSSFRDRRRDLVKRGWLIRASKNTGVVEPINSRDSCSMTDSLAPQIFKHRVPEGDLLRVAAGLRPSVPSSHPGRRIARRSATSPRSKTPWVEACGSGRRCARCAAVARRRCGARAMTDRALPAQLEGYGLTTAEIHYYRPDHPSLLQLRLAGL